METAFNYVWMPGSTFRRQRIDIAEKSQHWDQETWGPGIAWGPTEARRHGVAEMEMQSTCLLVISW